MVTPPVILVFVVAAVSLSGPAAHAGVTASVDAGPDSLTILRAVDEVGAADAITLSLSRTGFRLEGSRLRAGDGCARTDPRRVFCARQSSGKMQFDVRLGLGADSVRITGDTNGAFLGGTVDTGPGNDRAHVSLRNVDVIGGSGDDRLTGGSAQWGGPGDDRLAQASQLFGGGGNDHLIAAAGSFLNGDGSHTPEGRASVHPGSDVLDAAGHSGVRVAWEGHRRGVTVDLKAGTARSGRRERDVLRGRFADVEGSGMNDRLLGTERSDVLSGNGGNDLLVGRGGSDYLLGGGAGDRLIGGSGDDQLIEPGRGSSCGRGLDIVGHTGYSDITFPAPPPWDCERLDLGGDGNEPQLIPASVVITPRTVRMRVVDTVAASEKWTLRAGPDRRLIASGMRTSGRTITFTLNETGRKLARAGLRTIWLRYEWLGDSNGDNPYPTQTVVPLLVRALRAPPQIHRAGPP